MVEDFERCYRAVCSRDPRFDGWFFTAVTSTGVYCRPSCPARTPHRDNVRFYASAAGAQQAGFRACLRCRPDAAPGSPEWNGRADVVARAVRLIADGVVDREGVAGLAARLGYGARHLDRLLGAEVGAGPLALARAQRAQTARLLAETTDLPMAQVAFAAGFSSVRQFNDTVRDALGSTPSELRRRACATGAAARAARGARHVPSGVIALRLAYREPLQVQELLSYLGSRSVPGLESWDGTSYVRALSLPHGDGAVALCAGAGHVAARLALADLRDLSAAVSRCRRLLDLDADPEAVDAALGADDVLGPLVRAQPGRRVPGSVDVFELAARAVLGQQVSATGARTVAARLVAVAGKPLAVAADRLVGTPVPAVPAVPARTFPTAADLLDAPDQAFATTTARRATLRRLAGAVAAGSIAAGPGADPGELSSALLAVPGVGPWTVAIVRMRALGDPDAFVPGDLGVRRALAALGRSVDAAGAAALAERWRPWRAYAAVHLWATLDTAAGGGHEGKEDAT